MVAGAMMCGSFITKKVPIAMLVGAAIFLIAGSVCLGVYGNTHCNWYNSYNQTLSYNYCDNFYRENLLISGISCMVSAGIFLVVSLWMFYKISNNSAPQGTTYPGVRVVQGAALPHQPYVYPAQLYPAQQPAIGFTVQQQQPPQQQQQQQQPPAYY